MRFIVYYELNGANFYKIVKGGRAVQSLKRQYNVYQVSRY